VSAVITARDLAARVLVRVMRDQSFAAAALEAELVRAAQMDERDRALATELVYGTLRVLPFLESEIDARAKRPTSGLPWEARGALWVAAQQIFFMRVPAFAAVDEAVTSVRRAAGAKVAGFANALLRKLAAAPKPERARAVFESCPVDLRDALVRAIGDEGAHGFLGEGTPPPTGLRVRTPADRAPMMKRLAEARPNAELHEGRASPLCINARAIGKAQALPGFAEGELAIQEEGSQVVALSLGAQRGERVLDACAGRGNKTGVLAVAGAEVDACDRDPRKLGRLVDELARLRVEAHARFAVDWTVGSGDVHEKYAAVLVDAPCSGIGTLRRRPELALRPRASLAERTTAQRAIALAAAAHVAPGGRFVYAVCSVLREEAEDVVSAFDSADLVPAPFSDESTNALANGASSTRLLPYIHGTDGYFLASFRKR
jgi:16S rRNA (cytosine967-C5)-methyltransferase